MVVTLTPGWTISSMVQQRNVSWNKIISCPLGRKSCDYVSLPFCDRWARFQCRNLWQTSYGYCTLSAIATSKLVWLYADDTQGNPSWDGNWGIPSYDWLRFNWYNMHLSTLLFLADQARQNNATPVITFDQPLWWKTQTIITNEPRGSSLKSVVLRIGGLHIEMSYLGCTGTSWKTLFCLKH